MRLFQDRDAKYLGRWDLLGLAPVEAVPGFCSAITCGELPSTSPVQGSQMGTYSSWDDGTLRFRAFRIVMDGAAPLKKWAPYFSGSRFSSEVPLREKAFAIWLYTLMDYVGREPTLREMFGELAHREGVVLDELVQTAEELLHHYKAVLRLYSKSEQLFLVYIRQSVVHGAISLWGERNPKRTWYDPSADRVHKEAIAIDEFRAAINPLFARMPATIVDLLERATKSKEFDVLCAFVDSKLNDDTAIRLGRSIGLQINDHRPRKEPRPPG